MTVVELIAELQKASSSAIVVMPDGEGDWAEVVEVEACVTSLVGVVIWSDHPKTETVSVVKLSR